MRPYSDIYTEHYWAAGDPVAEKTAVFIQGNHLPGRLQAQPDKTRWVVAELGFGTGLNLALVHQAFARWASTGADLAYVAYEAHPLPPAELAAVHAALPDDVQTVLQHLQNLWPSLPPGWNTCTLPLSQLRVTLHLWLGEAAAGLPSQPVRAEAWLLDGFSPARNPAMWGADLLRQVAAASAPGATLATYSAARAVRQNLAAAGFAVTKHPGHPPKRHRLEAILAT